MEILQSIYYMFNTGTFEKVISIAGGAVIGTLLTGYIASKRETTKLRYDLQLKAVDLVMEKLKNITEISVSITNTLEMLAYSIEFYNNTLEYIRENNTVPQPKNVQVETIILGDKEVNNAICSVLTDHQEYTKLWENSKRNFTLFFNIFDTRRIILHKFYDAKKTINDMYKELCEIDMDLSNHFKFIFSKHFQKYEIFTEDDITYFMDNIKIFNIQLDAVINHLNNLQIELQNEFLGKIFRRKIGS